MIQKINDNKYVAVKGELRFVFEHFPPDTDGEFEKWIKFVNDEKDNGHRAYHAAAASELTDERHLALGLPERNTALNDGYVSLVENFENYSQTLWIASVRHVKGNALEMLMGVMMDPYSPLTLHMGINRCFPFLIDVVYGKQTITKGLALKLHGFAAAVETFIYPHKTMMMSAPVPVMTKIMMNGMEKIGKKVNIIESMFSGNHPLYIEAERLFALTPEGNELQLLQDQKDSKVVFSREDEKRYYELRFDIRNHFINNTIISNKRPTNERIDFLNVTEVYPPDGQFVVKCKHGDVVLSWDLATNAVTTLGNTYEQDGKLPIQFAWLNHSDLDRNPRIIIDLEDLVEYYNKFL